MPIPTGPANLIKSQIATNLQALVTGNVLGSYIEKDINTNIFDTEFPAYPCAVLGTSNQVAKWEYQQANRRTYTFDVLVVHLQDYLKTNGDMEDIRDAISTQFDNHFTLAGTAPLGVEAVFSEKITYASQGKTFVAFNVTIKATTLVPLTYNS